MGPIVACLGLIRIVWLTAILAVSVLLISFGANPILRHQRRHFVTPLKQTRIPQYNYLKLNAGILSPFGAHRSICGTAAGSRWMRV